MGFAVVVGAVRIGTDVLIASNSDVNCDIPDHSVVFGNPCVIRHKDDATREYVTNKIWHEKEENLSRSRIASGGRR